MKYCPKPECNADPDVHKKNKTRSFCVGCGGPLVDKPSASPPAPGGKILAGGDVTQNVSHHSETNVYNQDETKKVLICRVTGSKRPQIEGAICRQCNQWALKEVVQSGICKDCRKEKENSGLQTYRQMVSAALTDDSKIDADERKNLNAEAKQIGLSEDSARSIEEEIRREMASHSATLSPRDKLLFNRAHKTFYLKGDASKAFGNLKILAKNYPEHQEIARMYVLCSIEADPESGLKFLSHSPCFDEDSARKSLRKIELYEKLGETAMEQEEEQRALLAFADDPMIKAKALERLIDLYLEDEQEEEELEAVKELSGTWEKPGPEDDAYLHFVDAYLSVAIEGKTKLEPEGGGTKAEYFCSRKLRTSPHLFSFTAYFDEGMRLAEEEKWEQAVERLKIAAGGGHSMAQYKLGEMVRNPLIIAEKQLLSFEECFDWYLKSAEQGHAPAQHEVGLNYALGSFGASKNSTEAIKWLTLAANQEYVVAQFELGEMYANGRGIEQDDEEAAKWYRKAAEHDHAEARRKLVNLELGCSAGKKIEAEEKPVSESKSEKTKVLEQAAENFQKSGKVSPEDAAKVAGQLLKESAATPKKSETKPKEDQKKEKRAPSKPKELKSVYYTRSLLVCASLSVIYLLFCRLGEYLFDVGWINAVLMFFQEYIGLQPWFVGFILFFVLSIVGLAISYNMMDSICDKIHAYVCSDFHRFLPGLITALCFMAWKFPGLWQWVVPEAENTEEVSLSQSVPIPEDPNVADQIPEEAIDDGDAARDAEVAKAMEMAEREREREFRLAQLAAAEITLDDPTPNTLANKLDEAERKPEPEPEPEPEPVPEPEPELSVNEGLIIRNQQVLIKYARSIGLLSRRATGNSDFKPSERKTLQDHFGYLKGNELVNFDGNEIALEHILRARDTKVQTLDLSEQNISNVEILAHLTDLKSLFLRGNDIKELTPLFGLKNLTEIHLAGNPIPTDQLNAFRSSTPNCTVVLTK